jgi:hypothetical protein
MITTFMKELSTSIVLTAGRRRFAGRRQISHTSYSSVTAAIEKKSGCRRSSQKKQPALTTENAPSPART